jgi:hypothetical protein
MGLKRKSSAQPSKFWLILFLLPIGGLGLGIWLGMPRGQSGSFQEIATILPESTEVVLTIDTKPQSWSFLDKSLSPQAQEIVKLAVEQSPFFSLLRQTNMTWQKDVKPWSGGIIAVALLGNNQDGSKATVIIAPSKNRGGRDFLARYRQALGNDFKEQTYEGISYYQLQGNPDRSYVTAELKNNMIIASHPQALFQIIDVLQNRQKSLTTLSFLPPDQTQASLVNCLILLDQALPEQEIKEPKAISFTMSALTDDIGIKMITYFNKPIPNIPDRGSKLISLLPADTFFVLSGWQIESSWSFLQESLSSNNFFQQISSNITENSPFNLQEDILKWMKGEFTIGAIPAQEGILGKTAGFGLVFLAEAEKEASRRFFDRLDELAVNSEGGILPGGVTLQTNPARTLWQVGKSTAASHGFIEQTAYWGMGELGNRLKSSPSLPESPNFQSLTQGMKTENGGYFYLDMKVARDLFSQRIAPEDWRSEGWFQNTMTILNSIEGVAFTQSTLNDRATILEGKIKLGKSS